MNRFQSQEAIETESNFFVVSLGSVTNQQLLVAINNGPSAAAAAAEKSKTSLDSSDSAQWSGGLAVQISDQVHCCWLSRMENADA